MIWDSEAVTTIPPPSLPMIDPNDPNFVLGLPDEPSPPPSTEKESKKVGVSSTCNLVVVFATSSVHVCKKKVWSYMYLLCV